MSIQNSKLVCSNNTEYDRKVGEVGQPCTYFTIIHVIRVERTQTQKTLYQILKAV